MAHVHILWDESHIWGLLAVRAARAMGIPHRLVRGKDIAEGLFERERPSMLLVPGGNARQKAESLGPKGTAAIKEYVESGGQYLGFCGGAGLALSWSADRAGTVTGLGLCPWKRAGFDDRMQHFMSGHLHMVLPEGTDNGASHALIPPGIPSLPSLPVWWPGRFDQSPHKSITVLATYKGPGDDFWLADLPIAALPPDTFSTWEDMYGFSATPTFLVGQPCLIHGTCGKGAYTLSYSHLETPASPHANHWLAHIFRTQANAEPMVDLLPPWQLHGQPPVWEDPDLVRMGVLLNEVLQTGLDHGLLFSRNDWLMGWRTGMPGANLNNLRAALQTVIGIRPGKKAQAFWKSHGPAMLEAMSLFHKGCIQYLLAERLAMTLARSLPEAMPPALLKSQRSALFGPPMHAGGVYRDIMEPLDELAFLQMAEGGE